MNARLTVLLTLNILTLSSMDALAGGGTGSRSGTPTGLGGYGDVQTYGRAPSYLQQSPNNPQHLHAIFMHAQDSLNAPSSRRTGYAFSADGGVSWQGTSTLSGAEESFPSLTLLSSGQAAVACTYGSPAQTKVFIDAAEGARNFSALTTDAQGSDEPVMPDVQARGLGLTVVAARSAAKTIHLATLDFAATALAGKPASAAAQTTLTPASLVWGASFSDSTGNLLKGYRYGITSSPSGNRAAIFHLGNFTTEPNAVRVSESVDGGSSFGAFLTVLPFPTVIGGDTIAAWSSIDAVYAGETLHLVFSAAKITAASGSPGGLKYVPETARLFHWSAAQGLAVIADAASMSQSFPADFTAQLSLPQTNTFPVDAPSVGVSESGELYVAFQAARPAVSAAGFNFFNVYLTASSNGGASWLAPLALETAPVADYRYPAVAKFNAASSAGAAVVYQRDSQPGSSVWDDAPRSASDQLFQRVQISAQLGSASSPVSQARTFTLSQNYPNPFNPQTAISYKLQAVSEVSLKVFDVLGKEVSTLVDGRQASGNYSVRFNAAGLSSGVYFYRLSVGGQAGSFVETKKMLLVK